MARGLRRQLYCIEIERRSIWRPESWAGPHHHRSGTVPTCAERHRGTPTAASAHRSTTTPPPTSCPGRRRQAPPAAMPSSFLTSPSSSSSASSHLSYLIPANARPPPLAMGQGYGGATGGGIMSVPTASVVTTNALNAAAAPPSPPPPPRQQGAAARNAGAGHPPLPRPPPRQCPRCQSGNTKFCYYNNYSREQPRYLCKACRRHWTEGGTLRDVPVGGGRKNRRGGAKGSGSGAAAAKASAASAAAAAATQGGNVNVLGVGADTFPDLLRQLVQFQPGAAVGRGGGGYAIDLSAWQQMTAATAPPPQGTAGDVISTLGAAGAATEEEANCVALQYWSEWQQYGMPGLDGAC